MTISLLLSHDALPVIRKEEFLAHHGGMKESFLHKFKVTHE